MGLGNKDKKADKKEKGNESKTEANNETMTNGHTDEMIENNEYALKDLSCASFEVIKHDYQVMEPGLRPFFTLNNQFLCVPEKNRLEVFNVKNKLKSHVFYLNKGSEIVSSGPLYHDPKLVFIACSDRTIHFKDLSNKTTIIEYKLDVKINEVSTSPTIPNRLILTVNYDDRNRIWILDYGAKVEFNQLISQKQIQEHKYFEVLKLQNLILIGSIDCENPVNSLIIHPSIPNLSAVISTDMKEGKKVNQIKIINFINFEMYIINNEGGISIIPRRIYNIKFHPNECLMSFSSRIGKIYQIELNKNKDNSKYEIVNLPKTMHWHSLPINDLIYTPDGLSLLSGGKEGVLVSWALNSKEQHFLPRLRDKIQYIISSQDQSNYSIRYEDGSISIINPNTLQIKYTISYPVLKHFDFNIKKLPLLNNNNIVVLPGHKGSIDFFDIKLNQIINTYTPIKLNKVWNDSSLPNISNISFSKEGIWMASTTTIQSELFRQENFIHFWKYNRKENQYKLVLEINDPHFKTIKCMEFNNSEDDDDNNNNLLLATLSIDGTLKLWSNDNNNEWNCKFQSKRDNCLPKGLNFSQDDSLLCVTYDDKIAVWDCNNMILQQYIACPSIGNLIKAQFIPSSIFLVCIGDEGLLVFNLIAGEIWWTLPFKIRDKFLHIHNNDKLFSITCKDLLLTFNPDSPIPVFTTHLPFIPIDSINLANEILMISVNKLIYTITDNKQYKLNRNQQFINNNNLNEVNIFENVPLNIHNFNNSNVINNNKLPNLSVENNNSSNELDHIINIPSHLIPPTSQIITEFAINKMQNIKKKKNDNLTHQIDNKNNIESKYPIINEYIDLNIEVDTQSELEIEQNNTKNSISTESMFYELQSLGCFKDVL